MLVRRTLVFRTFHQQLCHFSQSAATTVLQDPIDTPTVQPLTYLPGFPRPYPRYAETMFAVLRGKSGKNISVKEREAGRVPSIVFEQEDGQHGGNMRLISEQNSQIKKLAGYWAFFLPRSFDLEVRPEFESDEVIEKVRVLPRLVCYCFYSCCISQSWLLDTCLCFS